MKRFRTFLLMAVALLGAGLAAQGKVRLPSFISDNMVLQQQTDVALWGWTDSGKTVTVRPSWTRQSYRAVPGEGGKWFLRVPTPEAGGPYGIRFSDGEETRIENVLIGEVWFCSGQSNMEMPVRGFHGQPVEGSAEVITSARPSTPIRICTIGNKYALSPQEECTGSWLEHRPKAVGDASAVAYFFAQKLQQVLEIPVGILITDWGGTPIETWMDREALEPFAGELNFAHLDRGVIPDKYPQCSCCMLYNGQVAPLVPFSFKGMIWYQGESNRYKPERYVRLQTAYVKMMRERFENPDAPFYYVQIAPYHYTANEVPNSGYFYEAQESMLDLIPHCGMAATVDIGDYACIHPPKKREVGLRLAYLALSKDYGVKGIDAKSPRYESVEFKDGKAVVSFRVGGLGLAPARMPISGFEIAGSDKVFHPATAIPLGKTVTVSSPEVPEPVAVRYCFHDWCTGTLFNNYGLPAYPFRTDNW